MNNGYSPTSILESAIPSTIGDQSISDDFKRGSWSCAEALMAWIKTLESLNIPKAEIYQLATNYRPDVESAPSALDFRLEYDYELLRTLEASK